MQLQQVVPIRTPESSFEDDVFTVLDTEGNANAKTDPKLDSELVVSIYRAMVRTRLIDERLIKLQRQGRIGFHIGSLGEEACIIASAAAMRDEDWIWPCYREFGALLWRGLPLQTYIDNMYGNSGDPVQGRQMPDHYTARHLKFGSVSSPIGTQMTQVVGLGRAAQLKGNDEVVSVYFGEGATSSNDFHTSMNFAGVMKAPVLFLCRNNRWAISVPSEKQTASHTFADKAIAYGMPGVRVDGNDPLATYKVVREAVERASRGDGPTMIEMLTYRMGGHSTSDDPRAYRAEDEVDGWRRMDPLHRTRLYLEKIGAWDAAKQDALEDEVKASLEQSIKTAEQTAAPELETLFDGVYEEKPWHLEEQEAELLAGPRAKKAH